MRYAGRRVKRLEQAIVNRAWDRGRRASWRQAIYPKKGAAPDPMETTVVLVGNRPGQPSIGRVEQERISHFPFGLSGLLLRQTFQPARCSATLRGTSFRDRLAAA